jgi:guanosine-3',5'-bis(diphosphate) 3'-pyrophosphohydrolase
VADNLLSIGKVRDADVIIAALLHDTVEDTETSLEDILERFGTRTEGFVREVTDDKSLPKQTRKQLQIEHAPHKSAGAAQIKLGDKLYNLRNLIENPPEEWESQRIDEYFQWAQKVVDNLPWVNGSLKKAVDETIAQYWNLNAPSALIIP